MNLLGYLVPAFRDIRAPLVGGYLWLLAAWLSFGDRVPEPSAAEPRGLWDTVFRLNGIVGAIGAAVLVSVAAYLVGSLVGELIEGGFRRWGVDTHSLERLGEAMPEVKYATESALRVHAEAALRWHLVGPLVATAVIVGRHEPVVGVVIAASAGLLGFHGRLLLRRTFGLAQLAMSIADDQRRQMTAQEREARSSDLKLIVDMDARSLRILNQGHGPARDIFVEGPSGEDPEFIVGGFLPIEELRPGDGAAIPLAIGFVTPSRVRVRVRWLDATGVREGSWTLSLTS